MRSRAIYHYNDAMANFFTAYKFQSGYHLRYTFTKIIKHHLKALDYDILVPVPVTIETLNRRGFDHVRGLLGSIKITPLLICSEATKPSLVHQGRQARLKAQQPFIFNRKLEPSRTNRICVFDDVYTTGRTMHHAMMVLKAQGYQHIQGLTLAR
ncbi:ComF family protein [Pediococcus pentosaceus]|uniref:ComF family protein n=1 Tax=Pediococcus pentosaceus TaxID=1255 RepID=UPI003981F849